MHLKSLLSVLLLFSFLTACNEPPTQKFGLGDKINKFQQSEGAFATCLDGTDKPFDQTLLLVDLTDELQPNQIQYVNDNYIDNIKWNNRGDTFALARMTSQPPEEMKVIRMCAPAPVSKDNSKLNEGNVKTFKKTYQEVFNEDNLLSANGKGAKNSLLIESVRQIFTSARYNFSSENGPRHFILVSDLYQNSSEMSFFKCNPKDKKCSFENMRKNKSDWFDAAKLNLNEKDRITIYHLSSKCRADLKAKYWWEAYFKSEGAGEVEIISELGTNKCSSPKPVEPPKKPEPKKPEPKEPKPVDPPKPVEPPKKPEPKEPKKPKKPEPVCNKGKAGPNTFQRDVFCD